MSIINDVLVDKLFPDKPKRTKEIPLLEEKSVSGESIIIRDAYPDMPFKGSHVYGKSTQVTTKGNQLLKDTWAEIFKQLMESVVVDGEGYFKFQQDYKINAEFSPLFSDISKIIPQMNDDDVVYFRFNKIASKETYNYQATFKTSDNKDVCETTRNGSIVSTTYGVLKNSRKIQFYFYNNTSSVTARVGDTFQFIISKNPKCEYEPYTGGKPSPSIEYPQEIVSVGDKGSINVDVDNNGYIQKGTYFDNILPLPLARGYTYHIEGNTKVDSVNCFVFNEINEILRTSSILYNYGYDSKQLKAINNTGIVDKECRMPMNYENGYTFKVTVDGLYLYQGVNQSILDTDDFYIGHHADIVDEEYKKQTLTIKTPNGLLGIKVDRDGNYTDENGQQWICDEIDLARGKYVQRVEIVNAKNIKWADFWNGVFPDETGKTILFNSELFGYGTKIMSNRFRVGDIRKADENIFNTYEGNNAIGVRVSKFYFPTLNEWNQYIKNNDVIFYISLGKPIERDLTPEEITAYKALHTNYPTTVIMNDENAGMKVTYLTPSFIPTRESALRMWFKENPII